MGIFDFFRKKKDIENNKKEQQQQQTKEKLKRTQKERKQSSNDDIKIYQDYYDNGKLKTKGNKKNGKRYGLWKFYHENGQLKEERSFNNDGFLHGKWRLFHENGKLKSETEYKNGKFISEKSWDESGNVDNENKSHKTISEYMMDNPGSSPMKEYYDTRELHVEVIPIEWVGDYGDGNITCSYRKEYYRNGKTKEEGHLKYMMESRDTWRWNQEGEWKFYYENGELKKEGNYKNDKLISKKCWDEDGNEIECKDE